MARKEAELESKRLATEVTKASESRSLDLRGFSDLGVLGFLGLGIVVSLGILGFLGLGMLESLGILGFRVRGLLGFRIF